MCVIKQRQTIGKRLGEQVELQLMILPAVIVVILFSYFPMYGILIAFKDYNIAKGIWESPWASAFGFEHFIDFFTKTPNAGQIIWNTVFIAILKLVFLTWPPVVLAIVINEVKHEQFKKITQTISYLPHFISWVIIGGIIYSLFSYGGVVNQIFIKMGFVKEPILYLGQKGFFRPLLVLSDLWKEVGWGSIIYLGVIVTIDPNLYEAIEIDGGGRWAKIVHITWPHLKGVFMILFILACGNIMAGMGSTFDQCYVLGNNMIKDVAQILDTYVLRIGLEQARFSFATAVGLFKSVINLILLISVNKLSQTMTGKSLF